MHRFRPAGMLLATLTMGLIALPYARPAVCHAVHTDVHAAGHMHGEAHAAHQMPHDAGPTLTAGSPGVACHGLMQCGPASVAPIADGTQSVAVPPTGRLANATSPTPIVIPLLPSSPPPRV